MTIARLLFIAALGVILSTPSSAQEPNPQAVRLLPSGKWAQKRGVLDSRFEGIVFVEPCVGNGFLPDTVMLDANGRFDVEGQFRFRIPVPEAPYFRARYVGQLRGSRIALTIISLDPDHPFVRSYLLRKGAKASFRGCPD